MALSFAHAEKLCTKAELVLIESSFSDNFKQLDDTRLKKIIELTQKKRDKFNDLANRQVSTAKQAADGKKPAGIAHLTNIKKKALFDEALLRYKAELTRREQSVAAGDRRQDSAAKDKSKLTRSARAKRKVEARVKSAKFKEVRAAKKKEVKVKRKAQSSEASTANSKDARKAARIGRNRSVVMHAHAKSANKRHQAKRDSSS